jgi:hypothetical protein
VVQCRRGGDGAGPAGLRLADPSLPYTHRELVSPRPKGDELDVDPALGACLVAQGRAEGSDVKGARVRAEDDNVRVTHVHKKLPVTYVAAI